MPSPVHAVQVAAFIVGATGVAQGTPPMSTLDYMRLILGISLILADVYLIVIRRRSKKR